MRRRGSISPLEHLANGLALLTLIALPWVLVIGLVRVAAGVRGWL